MRILKSETIMGLWNLSGSEFHRKLSSREGKDLIKKAYRLGIRWFDTAFSYGVADSLLFSAMKELGHDDIFIISKVMPVPSMRRKAEISLRRLGRESADVLLLHWPTEEKQLYESLRELERMQDDGLCSEIGVSNFPLSLLEKTSKDFRITYHERPLSLIWSRDYSEERKLGLKTLAYAPLGMGVLAGKGADDRRKELPAASSPMFPKLMKRVAGSASLALSWVYSKYPEGVISGFGKAEDFDVLSTIEELDDETMKELDALSFAVSEDNASDNIFSHHWK